MRALRRVVASAVFIALAGLPLLSGLPGCSSGSRDANMVVPTGPLPDLKDAGLRQAWLRHVRLDSGEKFTKAWRIGNSIYLTTTFARLIRIDAKTGVLMWSYGLGDENFQIYKPVELRREDGPPREVLVITRGAAFVFAMDSGQLVRSSNRLGVSVTADPLVIGNTICVGGAGTFYGLYLDRLGGKRWVVQAPGDLFESSPVAVDNNVILASRSGQLWRISADNGDWDWKDRKANGKVIASLAADGRAVYVPSLDQRVYAFSVDTGGELWTTQLFGLLDVKPSLAGPCVLVIAHHLDNIGTTLYALARTDGHIKWQMEAVTQVATVSDTTAWVGDNSGVLKLVDMETGNVLTSTTANSVQFFVRNADDTNLILVSGSGDVSLYQPR